MHSFRKNPTENITANIIWQYVSSIVDDLYIGNENVLIFNSKYSFHLMSKLTEMVAILNGYSVRIECKYQSKGSNFGTTIANDLLTLNHCKEDHILFVLNGEGFINNRLIDSLELEVSNNSFYRKDITFIMLNELDNYVSRKYNLKPNWGKKAFLIKDIG